jgi:ABC-type xylose transport system permease subunit
MRWPSSCNGALSAYLVKSDVNPRRHKKRLRHQRSCPGYVLYSLAILVTSLCAHIVMRTSRGATNMVLLLTQLSGLISDSQKQARAFSELH